MMPPVEEFDRTLAEIEGTLGPRVPRQIRERIRTTRNLAVYGAFSYDFIAVSQHWSYTCIEMALWTKFREMNPDTQAPLTLRPLIDWAHSKQLLPPNVNPPDALARLRNSFAHAKHSNLVVPPAFAVDAFSVLVQVVNHLWPLE
jgi:hypothetical protein